MVIFHSCVDLPEGHFLILFVGRACGAATPGASLCPWIRPGRRDVLHPASSRTLKA